MTLGLLGPLAAAVVPFCSTVAATVGPWAITAAGIALELNVLLLIKDLVDAATADTAEQLQSESDKVTQDAETAGNMAMQIGMHAVGEAGGKALMSTEFGQGLAAGAREIGEEFGITKPGGAHSSGARPPSQLHRPLQKVRHLRARRRRRRQAQRWPRLRSPLQPGRRPRRVPSRFKVRARRLVHALYGPTAPSAEPSAAPAEAPAPTEETTPAGEAAGPAADERIVAERPTSDGHTVKVNEQGECVVCSPTCPSLTEAVEGELEGEAIPPEEQATRPRRSTKLPIRRRRRKLRKKVRAEAQQAVEETLSAERSPPGGDTARAGSANSRRAKKTGRRQEAFEKNRTAGIAWYEDNKS